MFATTTLKIILRKDQPNKDDLYPIYLRFVQNRKTNRLSLNKWIPREAWLDTDGYFVKEKGKGRLSNGKELNLFLRSMLDRAEQIVLEAQRKNQSLSFQQFKFLIVNKDNQDFLAFCEQEMERRAASNFSPETIRSYRSEINKLRRFRKQIAFSDLTLTFLQDYEAYLHHELGNKVNTIFGGMKFIKTILNEARRKKLTDVYPFDEYKIAWKKDTRDRLEPNELEALQALFNRRELPDNYQHVLRYFLFACYTGLTWRDLEGLTYDEIFQNNDAYFIRKKRKKTDNLFIVPLLPSAKALIDLAQNTGLVFPKIYTNQKSNAYMKEVVKYTTIKKHITFHVARHTFGTTAMNYGIPQEVVQKMMGHAKADMTSNYAKVMDKYIIDEMQKWERATQKDTDDYQKGLSAEILEAYKQLRIKLISARIANGLSEVDIAEKLHVSVERYKAMEQGEVAIGVPQLMVLAKLLKIKFQIA